jgi:hypothetical protein
MRRPGRVNGRLIVARHAHQRPVPGWPMRNRNGSTTLDICAGQPARADGVLRLRDGRQFDAGVGAAASRRSARAAVRPAHPDGGLETCGVKLAAVTDEAGLLPPLFNLARCQATLLTANRLHEWRA